MKKYDTVKEKFDNHFIKKKNTIYRYIYIYIYMSETTETLETSLVIYMVL